MKFATAATLALTATLAAASLVRCTGCQAFLTATITDQGDVDEILTYAVLDKFFATEPHYVALSSADLGFQTLTSNTYIATILPDAAASISDDFIASVVETWPGTWLFSNTSSPSTADSGDFKVTSVTCT